MQNHRDGNPHSEDKHRIDSKRLLLVEGRDEVNLFKALIKRQIGDDADIQVFDVGGKDQFPLNFSAVNKQVKTLKDFRSIGVIRDADDDAKAALESVSGALRKAGYKPPDSHGAFSNASPSVGIFIVPDGPDGEEGGAIETLCRRSVEESDAGQCVMQYLECLAEHNAMKSTNRDKSFAHAYLAAMHNPVARVGEGASQGVWDFDSPVFKEIVDFIRKLQSE